MIPRIPPYSATIANRLLAKCGLAPNYRCLIFHYSKTYLLGLIFSKPWRHGRKVCKNVKQFLLKTDRESMQADEINELNLHYKF